MGLSLLVDAEGEIDSEILSPAPGVVPRADSVDRFMELLEELWRLDEPASY